MADANIDPSAGSAPAGGYEPAHTKRRDDAPAAPPGTRGADQGDESDDDTHHDDNAHNDDAAAAGGDGDNSGRITDRRVLRALAHPLRWALLEVLYTEESATASRCAEVLGEPPNACSFHLRMLAKYGLIERVPGSTGRERPWRVVGQYHSWRDARESTDEATKDAARALDEVFIQREADRQRAWVRLSPTYPPEWRRAARNMGTATWMTPAELTEIGHELDKLFSRHIDRVDPARRPPDAKLVRLYAVTMPLPPPNELR
jgi:DNA-binding MarR family transcriptional regulator